MNYIKHVYNTVHKIQFRTHAMSNTIVRLIMQYIYSITHVFITAWSLLVTYIRIMFNINLRAIRYITAMSIIHILLYVIPSQDTTQYDQSIQSTHPSQSNESISDNSDDHNDVDDTNDADDHIDNPNDESTNESTNESADDSVDDVTVAKNTVTIQDTLDHLRDTVNSNYIYKICNRNGVKRMANRIAFADLYSTLYNDINTVIASNDPTYMRILYHILNDMDTRRIKLRGWNSHCLSVLDDLRNDYMTTITNIIE